MSDVGSWDPGASLSDRHEAILDAAAARLEADDLGLEAEDRVALGSVMQLAAETWQQFADGVDDDRLVGWIKVLTVAEMKLPGCEAGARSPVIALARLLKTRGVYPDDLTAWIKAHTSNRFLPYGSLLDRLSG